MVKTSFPVACAVAPIAANHKEFVGGTLSPRDVDGFLTASADGHIQSSARVFAACAGPVDVRIFGFDQPDHRIDREAKRLSERWDADGRTS